MKHIELDFQLARQKHILFKTNLRSILYGVTIDHAPVISQYECSVGKWIYGHALEDYKDIPEMVVLEKVHADIHICARKLVSLYENGKVEEARKGLIEMESIADHLINLLTEIEAKINQGSSQFDNQESTLESEQRNNWHKESQELHKTIKSLDERIKEQTALSIATIKSAEDKFRVLANSMPQFIWTATPDGNLNYFSQSVFDFTGFTEKTIEEVGWLDIVHPDEREKNIELWMESITTGKDFHYEHRFRKHDGLYRWQLSRAVPQKDEAGNILMWVGTSTDIHDRKLFTDELKEKVEEQTKDLKAINESLVRSNNELTQFNYVASHDLQEPLRKIQTFVDRIMAMDYENLSDKSKDLFIRLEKSSNRTRKLIEDLLTFSKTNAIDKLFVETDLNDILNKVKEDLIELLDHSGTIITSDTLPILPIISFQIEQLFTNLITNSIKFTKPGTNPTIAIRYQIIKGSEVTDSNVDSSKRYHLISFEDTGIGLNAEYKERIFMVFQRLKQIETEGTGIGLAICKKIMENHYGSITADGQEGIGTVFYMYFPIEFTPPKSRNLGREKQIKTSVQN